MKVKKMKMKKNSLPEGAAVSPQPLLTDEGRANLRGEERTAVPVPSSWVAEAYQLHSEAKKLYPEIFNAFRDFVANLGFRVILEARIKSLDSILEKMQRKQKPASKFSDLIGIRVTVKPENFRFLTSRLSLFISKHGFTVRKVEVKLPNSHRDYSAVHWDLSYKGFPIELQLMTPSQRRWAIIAHDTVYKKLKDTDLTEVDRKLREIHRRREQELRDCSSEEVLRGGV